MKDTENNPIKSYSILNKTIEEVLVNYNEYIEILSKTNKVNSFEPEDLQQEFRMILVKCYDNFKDRFNTTFKTYFTSSCLYKVDKLRKKYKELPLSLDVERSEGLFLNLVADKKITPDLIAVRGDIIKHLDEMPNGNITKMYLLYNISQEEIAKTEGCTQQYISRIHAKNIKELQRIFKK